MGNSDVNFVLFIGRLTKDPELRFTESGVPCCNISLAVNKSRRGKGGKESTLFITVVSWGKDGENAALYLKKSSTIKVVGELIYEMWTDRDGNKRSTYKVTAERGGIQFLNLIHSPDAQEGEVSADDANDLPVV